MIQTINKDYEFLALSLSLTYDNDKEKTVYFRINITEI